MARVSSRMNVVLPKARCALWRASSELTPSACRSSVSSSRSERSSRSRSSSRDFLRHQRISTLLGRPHDLCDRARHFLPLRLFRHKLLPSSGSEPIVFEFALPIFAGNLPFGRNPPLSFKPVEGRVKGPVLNLQQVVRCALDVLSNLMSVSGSE